MKKDRVRWEARYQAGDRPHDGPASSLLRRWLPRLPRSRRYPQRGRSAASARHARRARHIRGRALDVAAGLGRNALFLARAGYRVDAIDISSTSLRVAARRAKRAGLRGIRWIAADLDAWRPLRGRYDVVVNAFFLKRRLYPALRAALRPGGVLILETHLFDPHEAAGGRRGRTRRLKRGELRKQFGDWEVLYFREGRCREAGRTLALGRIVARRPSGPRARVVRRSTARAYDPAAGFAVASSAESKTGKASVSPATSATRRAGRPDGMTSRSSRRLVASRRPNR